MQESIAFLVRVQCRRKESSRSLSHLLMSFLLFNVNECFNMPRLRVLTFCYSFSNVFLRLWPSAHMRC